MYQNRILLPSSCRICQNKSNSITKALHAARLCISSTSHFQKTLDSGEEKPSLVITATLFENPDVGMWKRNIFWETIKSYRQRDPIANVHPYLLQKK